MRGSRRRARSRPFYREPGLYTPDMNGRGRTVRSAKGWVGSVALCPLDMNRRSRRVRSKEARRHTAASRGARPAERRLVQGTFVALPYTAAQKQQRPPPARLASGGGATDRVRAVCVRAGKDVRVGRVSREHEAMRRPRARPHHDAASHSAPLSKVPDERAEEGSEWGACDTQQAWEPRRAGRLLRWSPGWHTLLEPRPLPECYFFGGWRASGLPHTAAVSPRANSSTRPSVR